MGQELGELVEGGEFLRRLEIAARAAEHRLGLGHRHAITAQDRRGQELVVGGRPPMDVAAFQQQAMADALAKEALLLVVGIKRIVVEAVVVIVMGHDPAVAQAQAEDLADLRAIGLLLDAGGMMHGLQDVEAGLRPAEILHQ